MTTETKRRLMTDIMNATARGDTRPLAEAMQNDFVFRPMTASRKEGWGGCLPQ
jgi:hypothetical protein